MNIFSEVTNEDNMEMLSRYPDKFWDLAIVDPPYGLPKNSPKRYAQNGDKILDIHLGSGSSRIAAYKLGVDFLGL